MLSFSQCRRNIIFISSLGAKADNPPTPNEPSKRPMQILLLPPHAPISLLFPYFPSPHLRPPLPFSLNSLSRKQRILISQKLSTIRLPKRRNTRRIQPARLRRASRRNAKAQRCIVHAVHHDALVLGTVFAPAPDMRFHDVAAVEEGHLAVGFDPDFVAGVLGEDGQGGDVQAEFEGFGKLAWGGWVSY